MSSGDHVGGPPQTSYVPNWTRYDHEEFLGRLAILVDEIHHTHKTRGRDRTTEQLQEEALSWAYHLETVPTKYLGAACQRAIQSWRSQYTMPASAVLAAWDEISEGLMEGVGVPDEMAGTLALPPPQGWHPHDYMGLREWKEKHGLPKGWKWGDPIPQSSDLYESSQKPVVVKKTFAPPQGTAGVEPDPRWFQREHAPWELLGSPEQPMQKESVLKLTRTNDRGYVYTENIRTLVVSWCERCPTIDFGPEVVCPGYVTEYIITTAVGKDEGGRSERHIQHQCPIHASKHP